MGRPLVRALVLRVLDALRPGLHRDLGLGVLSMLVRFYWLKLYRTNRE